jgi:hypothetical protein
MIGAMNALVIVVILVFLALAVGLSAVALRREKTPPRLPEVEREGDNLERQARHDVLDERGSELLKRRVDLDMRRGTLGGNTEVYEAFEQLESNLRAGKISEDEFEREKIRLLGG